MAEIWARLDPTTDCGGSLDPHSSATGHLAQFVVFGSFVTEKACPLDLDLILVMEDTFDLDAVVDDSAVIFQRSPTA